MARLTAAHGVAHRAGAGRQGHGRAVAGPQRRHQAATTCRPSARRPRCAIPRPCNNVRNPRNSRGTKWRSDFIARRHPDGGAPVSVCTADHHPPFLDPSGDSRSPGGPQGPGGRGGAGLPGHENRQNRPVPPPPWSRRRWPGPSVPSYCTVRPRRTLLDDHLDSEIHAICKINTSKKYFS